MHIFMGKIVRFTENLEFCDCHLLRRVWVGTVVPAKLRNYERIAGGNCVMTVIRGQISQKRDGRVLR